jgi:hypothetical protein
MASCLDGVQYTIPHKTETKLGEEGILATHEVVCLVKRPLYELCFAIPKGQAGFEFESNGGPLFQVRFTGQSQLHALVLRIDETEDFFDGLSRLMDYIHAEMVKRQGQI